MIIEATDIKVSTSRCYETCYFTGGLFAQPTENGSLLLAPTGLNEQGLRGYVASCADIHNLIALCGNTLVGVNRAVGSEGSVPNETWLPNVSLSDKGLQAAESWGAISYQAHCNNDASYAAVARYLSITMHAAGFRLRDVARAHHNQLRWAILEKKKPGSLFSNVAMTDLYLAFHSLASELCSARDHLARLAAIHCGAEPSIDALARLETWLSKSANAGARNEPLIILLLSACGTKDVPNWLRIMGELRNEMLHRQPMAANPQTAFLMISQTTTPAGPVHTIRLTSSKKGDEFADPFQTLFDLYRKFESLATAASALARYKVEPPQVVGR